MELLHASHRFSLILAVYNCLFQLYRVAACLSMSQIIAGCLSLFLPVHKSCCMSITVSYCWWLSITVSQFPRSCYISLTFSNGWLLSHFLFGPIKFLHSFHSFLGLLAVSHYRVAGFLSLSSMLVCCLSLSLRFLRVATCESLSLIVAGCLLLLLSVPWSCCMSLIVSLIWLLAFSQCLFGPIEFLNVSYCLL